MFLLFSRVLELFFVKETFFVTSYVTWYVGLHEFTIFIMRTHWDAINGFMMSKYFHKRLCEYYSQRPVRFVDFLVNPSDQKLFLGSPPFLFIILLLFLCFIKLIIFHKYCKYAILLAVSYGTSSSFR